MKHVKIACQFHQDISTWGNLSPDPASLKSVPQREHVPRSRQS